MTQKLESLDEKTDYKIDKFENKAIHFSLFSGISIIGDKYENISQETYLDKFINIIATQRINSRDEYEKDYQDSFSYLVGVYMGCSSQKSHVFADSLEALLTDHKMSLGLSMIMGTNSVGKDINEYIKQSLDKADIPYEKDKLKNAGPAIASLIRTIAIGNPEYSITFILNIGNITSAHHPELCIAWLMSFDNKYNQ